MNRDSRRDLLRANNEILVTAAVKYAKRARELSAVKNLLEIRRRLALEIIAETERATEIEDLLELEMMYQDLDAYFAASDADLNSISIAQAEYQQVMNTIRQMRRSPVEYLEGNRSARKTHGNLRIIDRTKALEQIQGNKTRLRNRADFASLEWRDMWKARGGLANKTERMYRALHNKLVDDYERDMAP